MKVFKALAAPLVAMLICSASQSALAEESHMNAVQTALSSTTISGYVIVEWQGFTSQVQPPAPSVPPAPPQLSKVWWSRLWMWLMAHRWI